MWKLAKSWPTINIFKILFLKIWLFSCCRVRCQRPWLTSGAWSGSRGAPPSWCWPDWRSGPGSSVIRSGDIEEWMFRMLRLCLHCLKLWKLWLTDILPQNCDWILTYSATRSLCNPLVVILPSLVLIFTIILLMETWRVIKDNGPINTVISANKIFTA